MEYRYIELFVNQQYRGLYALGYPIDELQVEVDESQNERLYKKRTWDSEEQILSQPDAAVAGFDTEESDANEWEILKAYYAALHSEWEDAQCMYAGIDIDNAIDMYLFINLIQGIDHVGVINSLSAKNMFLSFHNKGGEEKVLYTPWDMDITWGLQWTGDAETNMCKAYGIPADQNTVMGIGNLPSLILNGDDKIWGLILDKYRHLRETLWTEDYLNAILDEYEEDIYFSGAYLREMERWPDGSYWDVDKGLEDFRSYVADRLRETDDYYRRLEELVSGENATKNVYIVRSAQYKDFLQSDFILVLNDRTLLDNDDYKAFLEYIGIDVAQLTDDVNFAVISGADKKAEYFETLRVPEGVDTCIGHIRLEEDSEANGSCRIYVDDSLWRSMDLRGQNGIELLFGDAGSRQEAFRFDFSKQYVMWSRLCELGEPHAWCE
ncbi:MAG: CotH kinase family protein, partial [Lachnospiraceae bacterium]|nr:CotH kinase family protein [Lachnospiraceae bacterium]